MYTVVTLHPKIYKYRARNEVSEGYSNMLHSNTLQLYNGLSLLVPATEQLCPNVCSVKSFHVLYAKI